jgi:Protein of unknown function (DUF2878)
MKLVNFALFQLGWFISVWGAGHQKLIPSMLVVGLILIVHIMQARFKKDAIILVLIVMLLGPIFDQCLLSLSVIKYESQFSEYMVPIWIFALWGLFASTLNLSLSWLKQYKRLALIFGLIGGPLAYIAAEKLNAVQLISPYALILLAVGWALLTPLSLIMAQKWNGFRA